MRRHLRAFTVLSLIAGLLAWGAAPASARPGRLILHRHAIPGRYIVVLRSSVPRAPGVRRGRDGARATEPGVQRRVHLGARRVRRRDDADAGAADQPRPACRLRGAGRGGAPVRDAVAGDLGPGPHRPARRCRSTTRTRTPTTASGVTAYIIDTGIRITHQRVRRPRHERLRRDRRRAAPTTATATARTSPAPIGGTTYGVAKGVQLVARARARLRRLAAAPSRRRSPASTG